MIMIHWWSLMITFEERTGVRSERVKIEKQPKKAIASTVDCVCMCVQRELTFAMVHNSNA